MYHELIVFDRHVRDILTGERRFFIFEDKSTIKVGANLPTKETGL